MREAHAHRRNSWGSVTWQWILNANIISRGKTQHFWAGKRLLHGSGFLLLGPDRLVVKVTLDLLSLFPPKWCQQGVPAGPVLSWPGLWAGLELSPALGTWGCPTSPLCHPLVPPNPCGFCLPCCVSLWIVSLCLAWQLRGLHGMALGPYRSSARLCMTFCRDEGQGQSPILLG